VPGPAIGAIVGAAVGGQGGALVGAMQGLAGAGKKASTEIQGLSRVVTDTLLAPLHAIQNLAGPIVQLVQLFNPGVVTQFELAVNDAMAVLGSALVPVLQGITLYTRMFGDALATLMPALKPLFDEIGQFIASLGSIFMPIVQAISPLVEIFSRGLGMLLHYLSLGVAVLSGIVTEVVEIILHLFGIKPAAAQSSTGFAARQTRVSTVSQFAEDLFASSAKNIYARQTGAKGPNEMLVEIKTAIENGKLIVQNISKVVEDIYKWATKMNLSDVQAVINYWKGRLGLNGDVGVAGDKLSDVLIGGNVRTSW